MLYLSVSRMAFFLWLLLMMMLLRASRMQTPERDNRWIFAGTIWLADWRDSILVAHAYILHTHMPAHGGNAKYDSHHFIMCTRTRRHFAPASFRLYCCTYESPIYLNDVHLHISSLLIFLLLLLLLFEYDCVLCTTHLAIFIMCKRKNERKKKSLYL